MQLSVVYLTDLCDKKYPYVVELSVKEGNDAIKVFYLDEKDMLDQKNLLINYDTFLEKQEQIICFERYFNRHAQVRIHIPKDKLIEIPKLIENVTKIVTEKYENYNKVIEIRGKFRKRVEDRLTENFDIKSTYKFNNDNYL